MKWILITLILPLVLPCNTRSQIITVKQDGTGNYTTIQAGVNAAQNSDTVLVWPGIYLENVEILGKVITIGSLYLTTLDKSYINSTIIDGHASGSCLRIKSQLNDTVLICGMTCKNGTGYGMFFNGGGIYIRESKVKVSFCIIKDNHALVGGGIYCRQESDLFLAGNIITNNHAIILGGGINYSWDYDGIIQFSTIYKNSIYLNYSGQGSDFRTTYTSPLNISLDTGTVLFPDHHFFVSTNMYAYIQNNLNITVLHGKIMQANADLYVSPDGNDDNIGIIPEQPLKSVSFAFKKIVSDSLYPHTIHLAPGIYSPSTTGEKFPLSLRSYISLIGEDTSNTILDAELLSQSVYGQIDTRNYALKNITFRNSSFNYVQFSYNYAGLQLWTNFNYILENIRITNSFGYESTGIGAQLEQSAIFNNVSVENGIGGVGLFFSDGIPGYNIPNTKYYVNNCKVTGIKPDPDNIDSGGGARFYGTADISDKEESYVTNLQVTNCIQSHDPIWGDGGGVAINSVDYIDLLLVNSTVSGNSIEFVNAGALGADNGANVSMYNCILFDDDTPYEIYLGHDTPLEPSSLNVSYSNVEGGENGVFNSFGLHTLNWLEGNIDSDPLWDTTAAIPYAIPWNSPCVNSGTPTYEPGMLPPYIIEQDSIYKLITYDYDTITLPAMDLAGNPRIAYGRIDMGAYEFPDTIVDIQQQKIPDPVNIVNVYPNPFYENAFISLTISEPGKIRLAVYDIRGTLIRELMDAQTSPGRCSITWDGKDDFGDKVALGEYIIKVRFNDREMPGIKVVKWKWRW